MEDPDLRISTSALIVAAGLSSRMKRFKPLLPLGEKTIIERVVRTLKDAGIENIVLVTGYQADEIEHLLADQNITFIRNGQYADTQMFESVKIGMHALAGKCGRFFFLPGDIPLFRPHTLTVLLDVMKNSNADVVSPVYSGKRGHPALVSQGMIQKILDYSGGAGLKGALASLECTKVDVSVPDPGILMDADTPEDYLNLLHYQSVMEYPTPEVCMEIFQWFDVEDRIIEHGRAVVKTALELTDDLARAGYVLNRPLVEAAALLHDIARREKDHALCGSIWLRQIGYPAVAQIVTVHMDIPQLAINELDERAIVYLADKLVIEDKRVPLRERFEKALIRFGNDPKTSSAILERMSNAQRIADLIREKIAGSGQSSEKK